MKNGARNRKRMSLVFWLKNLCHVYRTETPAQIAPDDFENGRFTLKNAITHLSLFSNFSSLKSVFKKPRFRDRLERTVGTTLGEIELRFKVSSANCVDGGSEK